MEKGSFLNHVDRKSCQTKWLESSQKIVSKYGQNRWNLSTWFKIVPEAHLHIDFEENVKKTTAVYLYNSLSLIAEIGGHVGLFLGFSVYQVTNIFDYLISKAENYKE